MREKERSGELDFQKETDKREGFQSAYDFLELKDSGWFKKFHNEFSRMVLRNVKVGQVSHVSRIGSIEPIPREIGFVDSKLQDRTEEFLTGEGKSSAHFDEVVDHLAHGHRDLDSRWSFDLTPRIIRSATKGNSVDRVLRGKDHCYDYLLTLQLISGMYFPDRARFDVVPYEHQYGSGKVSLFPVHVGGVVVDLPRQSGDLFEGEQASAVRQSLIDRYRKLVDENKGDTTRVIMAL